MKHLQRILPVIAILSAIGGAIYYVQSNAPAAAVEVSKSAPATAPGNTAPVSDRYAPGAN